MASNFPTILEEIHWAPRLLFRGGGNGRQEGRAWASRPHLAVWVQERPRRESPGCERSCSHTSLPWGFQKHQVGMAPQPQDPA